MAMTTEPFPYFDPADLVAFRDHRLTATASQERQAAAVRHLRAKQALLIGWIAWVALQDPQSRELRADVMAMNFGRWERWV